WLTGESADADQVQLSNSQTIPLLQASLNPNFPDATGGGDITIVGQSALLAEVGPLGSIADIEDKVPADRISIYVVREGDTLTGIAKMFDVSVNTILWANNIGRYDPIKIGQTLIVFSVSGAPYEVKAGDTVESIAEKLKGDANEIRQFNDLSASHPLAVGMKIFIPDGEAPIPPSTNISSGSYQGGSGPAYPGYYIRPIEGGRNSRATASNPRGIHGYKAVDLAVSCGTPIVASAKGDVLMARSGGWNGGYGNFIIIDHPNGTQTLYAHTLENIVGAGWHVVQGQVIGYVGVTGNTTGCHVHIEFRGAEVPLFY
ncbi:MAG: M23 family metallopeptidase, partial [bacterium]|nr:M23 family metallopeptidase [bacterium]